jgi:hypothetical protein
MKHIHSYDEFVNEKFADRVKDAYKKTRQKVKDFSIKGLYKDTVDFSKNVWEATKREGKETRQAIGIMRKMIKGQEVSDKEKAFFKKQAGDIAKVFPLIALQGIPGGSVAITPLLNALGKKYNFNPFPTANEPIKDKDNDSVDEEVN